MPFVSNLEKATHAEKMELKRQKQENEQNRDQNRAQYQSKPGDPKPVVNLQVYNQQQVPPPRPKDWNKVDMNNLDPSLFLPSYVQNPFLPPQYGLNGGVVPGQAPIVPTILKNYNITMPGPAGMHEKMSYIYEDMLPTINIPGKITTLSERNLLSGYLRSILFSGGDGDDINLDERNNSLLEYIKFGSLNPYNNYELDRNPYHTLPKDFLIYRSAYPIQKNPATGSIEYAKNAVALNVRIYKLTEGSYYINMNMPFPNIPKSKGETDDAYVNRVEEFKKKLDYRKDAKKTDYKEWRDVAYYQYITSHILKKNICPNFVGFLGYYINQKSNINFDQLSKIKSRGLIKPSQPLGFQINDIFYPNPQAYTGKALIVLTESPLYNLLGFASTKYERHGNVKKMVRTGFFNENIWFSILFQIMAALYVLQKNKIYFLNFNINKNVFIKDIAQHSNLTNYWKYIIDGIEYFIPNYGYVALIDSGYQDVDTDTDPSGHKIISQKIFGSETIDPSIGDIHNNIHDNMFKKVFNPEIFRNNRFLESGGIKPPESVMDFINCIHEDNYSNKLDDKDIKNIIENTMERFMHTRIGDYLSEAEVANILLSDTNFKKGQIVVIEEQQLLYYFALFLNKDSTIDNNCWILLKKNDNYEKKSIQSSSIKAYSRVNKIAQTFRANEINLNDDGLIETYIIQ